MAAPDRSAEVALYVSQNSPVVETEDDAGRRSLLYSIVRQLNYLDVGRWGVLVKHDQGGKIPADVIVWAPTLEHFDVLTGSDPPGTPVKATWHARGVISNPNWKWKSINDAVPPQPPDPPTMEDETPPWVEEVLAEVRKVNERLSRLAEVTQMIAEATRDLARVTREAWDSDYVVKEADWFGRPKRFGRVK